MNFRQRIQAAQRENEVEVLAYLRRHIRAGNPISHTAFFGVSWRNALERLCGAGVVEYVKATRRTLGYYRPVKNARPVTKAVR